MIILLWNFALCKFLSREAFLNIWRFPNLFLEANLGDSSLTQLFQLFLVQVNGNMFFIWYFLAEKDQTVNLSSVVWPQSPKKVWCMTSQMVVLMVEKVSLSF